MSTNHFLPVTFEFELGFRAGSVLRRKAGAAWRVRESNEWLGTSCPEVEVAGPSDEGPGDGPCGFHQRNTGSHHHDHLCRHHLSAARAVAGN